MIAAAISTLEADPDGAIVLSADLSRSSLGDYQRRVQRSAALDGGVVVVDNGFTHADRTVRLDITAEPEETHGKVKQIVELYSSVLLYLPDGAYRATPERYTASGSSAMVSLLITGPAEVRL